MEVKTLATSDVSGHGSDGDDQKGQMKTLVEDTQSSAKLFYALAA